MTKLANYLKPYLGALLLAVILLFVQAMSDLNLPNFMSDIVNVGIQQNGIEHAAPDVISEAGYQFMTTFMTDEQKAMVDADYTLKAAGEASEEDQQTWPESSDEAVYVLDSRDTETYDRLDPVFGDADWTMINYFEELAAAQGNSTAASDSSSVDNMDMTKLYAMTPMLAQLPETAFDSAREKAMQTPESTRVQTGAMMTKLFYEELGADTAHMQTMYILKIGSMMLGLSLLGVAASISVGFLAAKIAAGVSRTLRNDIFKRVETFSNTEFDRFSTASLITRSTNDITQVQTFLIMGIRMICYAPIMGIGGVIMALKESTSMSWVIALAVVVLFGVIIIAFTTVMPRFKIVQQLVDRLNLVMRENLNGMSVIRAFGNQDFERERFRKENERVTRNNLFINRTMVFMMPAMMFIMNGVTLLIVWVGAHQIADSTMQVGNMMAFMQYAMQIIMAFLMISMMFILVPRASVSGERIAEVIHTEPVIKDPETPQTFPGNCPGTLVFDHVSFRYQGADEDVLHDISFTARPGETTAFIGSTGSGKSTLINLIPRFYDITEGAITLDDTDIRSVTLHDLREKIGYVPQKGILFSGNIDSNLRYGRKEASEEEVRLGAEIAQAMEFIEANPDGFSREIAQGGDNVSGGQKQRLSIARALVKKPDVYIFDDSFSALDFKTDARLRKALKGYTQRATVLIVAQRINTIMHADQIIVLDEGRVVGKGTHEELLKHCKTYQEIASSQLSKEELGNVR